MGFNVNNYMKTMVFSKKGRRLTLPQSETKRDAT